jgi:hypothetical protein
MYSDEDKRGLLFSFGWDAKSRGTGGRMSALDYAGHLGKERLVEIMEAVDGRVEP